MKKKILALAMAAIMLIVAVVGGTLAYFTDSDAENNVFTVGNIDIDLREHKDDQLKDDFVDVTGVMPGMSYNKFIDVKNIGDNNAYIKVVIDIPENMIPVWNDSANWSHVSGNLYGPGPVTFYYTQILAPEAVTDLLLKQVTLSPSVTELNAADKYEVKVSVSAIQADSFANHAEAIAALDAQFVATTVMVSDVDKINTQLDATTAHIVLLSNDVTAKTYIDFTNTAHVLDGNGYKLTKTTTADTTNAGVLTAGGKIKNIDITGISSTDGKGFRAVMANDLTADLILDNVVLNGTYALNVMGAGEETITVKNSTLNGWTSYGGYASAEFTDVKFGWNDGSVYAHLRPYTDTVLTRCDFANGFTMASDVNAKESFTIIVEDCTWGGVDVTAENFQTLFGITAADTYANVLIERATVVVDGVTVVWAD